MDNIPSQVLQLLSVLMSLVYCIATMAKHQETSRRIQRGNARGTFRGTSRESSTGILKRKQEEPCHVHRCLFSRFNKYLQFEIESLLLSQQKLDR